VVTKITLKVSIPLYIYIYIYICIYICISEGYVIMEDFPQHTQLFTCHLHSSMCIVLNNFMVQVFNLAIGNIQKYMFYKLT
jgi:hypothetical protein